MNSIKKQRISALKTSIREGSAFEVMNGFGSRYLAPFAIAIGASNTFMSLFATLPSLIAEIAQVATLKSLYGKSRKRVVIFNITLQTLFWIPLIITAILFYYRVMSMTLALTLLFISYTLITIFGSLAKPAWSSWMRDLVNKKSEGNYFGKRTAIIGSIGIIAMIIAGIILDLFKKTQGSRLILGFATLFTVALIARAVSLSLFKKQYEPRVKNYSSSYFSFFSFIKNIEKHGNNFGRFSVFIGVFGLAVGIASPFFSVYMLRDIGFANSYISYTIISIVSLASIIVFSPSWGRMIDKHGNVAVMKFCSFAIAFVPLLWALSYPIYIWGGFVITTIYLFIIEIFTGFVWGGYNLASGVFIYEAVSKEKMSLCVAYNGIIGATGAVIGSIIGRALMSLNFEIAYLGITNYFVFIFIMSFLARLITAIFFSSTFKEVRKVKETSLKFKDVEQTAMYPLATLKKYSQNPHGLLYHFWKAI